MLSEGKGVDVDNKEAFRFFKLATLGGVLPAFHNLGNCYKDGKGTEVNHENAVHYYEIAAQGGDIGAKLTLGNLYTSKKTEASSADSSVPSTKARGYELIKEAAMAGHPMAAYNMGHFASAGRLCCACSDRLFLTLTYRFVSPFYRRHR